MKTNWDLAIGTWKRDFNQASRFCAMQTPGTNHAFLVFVDFFSGARKYKTNCPIRQSSIQNIASTSIFLRVISWQGGVTKVNNDFTSYQWVPRAPGTHRKEERHMDMCVTVIIHLTPSKKNSRCTHNMSTNMTFINTSEF